MLHPPARKRVIRLTLKAFGENWCAQERRKDVIVHDKGRIVIRVEYGNLRHAS